MIQPPLVSPRPKSVLTAAWEQVEEDAKPDYPYSYIEKHWDDMYLGSRCPLPININPGYSLSDDPSDMAAAEPQAYRAAKFILSTFRWQKDLMDGDYDHLIVAGGVPQCMSQLGR